MTDDVERLLTESGLNGDDQLRRALTQLQADSTSTRPTPSPELSELLTSSRPVFVFRKHRGTLTALIVIGAVSGGVTAAAAASPEVRASVQHVFEVVTGAHPDSPATPTGTSSPRPETVPGGSAPGQQSSSPSGSPSAHPTTGVGNGAPKPTPGASHRPKAPNTHAASPPAEHGQGHRP
ncbi:MAG TPA: hypothetical protein VGM38_06935 [Pseudolysinimonas sp.]